MLNNARLVIVSGNAKQKEVPLTHFPFRVGRTREADLPIPHNLVSRNHCEIDVEDDWLVVYDLGSSNGTRVNDEKIESAYLQPGDELTIGPLTFVAKYDVLEEVEVEADTESSAVDLSVADLIDSGNLSAALDSDVISGTTHDTDLDADSNGSGDSPDDVDFNPAHLIADHKPDDEDSILDDDFDNLDDLDLANSAVVGGGGSQDDSADKSSGGPDSVLAEAMQGLTVAPDSATVEKTARGDSSEDAKFPLRLRLTDAGAIVQGTRVRAAGVEVGRVKAITWAEADGQLYAEAQLKIQERLASLLKTDACVKIAQHDGVAVVLIESPGQHGQQAEPGQLYVLS